MARLGKMILAHNCFPFTLIYFKLCTKTPLESRICSMDFGAKGQGHNALITEKWFMSHNFFPFTPIILKLHTKTPHESRMCPIGFEVKGEGHNAFIIENGFSCLTAFPLHLHSSNFAQRFPVSPGYALIILG